jgi:hypothetical protein
MYRLHIDVPCGTDQAQAIALANELKNIIIHSLRLNQGGLEIGIRLGNDTDQGKKDYLRINDNGHAANGKQKIVI